MTGKLIAISILASLTSCAPTGASGGLSGAPLDFETSGQLVVTDTGRPDLLDSTTPRQWNVFISPAAAKRTGYADDPALIDAMIADGYYDQQPAQLRAWLRRPVSGAVRRAASGMRPLILLLPGQGVAAFNYTILAQHLNAHGFAVAILDLPYLGFAHGPDGKLRRAADDPLASSDDPASWRPRVASWEIDVSRSIDALQRSRYAADIDFSMIIAAGHSLGGTVALDACKTEPRVWACADFEGAPFGTLTEADGPDKPVLFVLSRSLKPDRPLNAPDGEMVSFLAKGKTSAAWALAVGGGSHMSFSDAPIVMPDTISRFGGEVMEPDRSMTIYSDLLSAFALAYLPGGAGAVSFKSTIATIPEVRAANVGRPR